MSPSRKASALQLTDVGHVAIQRQQDSVNMDNRASLSTGALAGHSGALIMLLQHLMGLEHFLQRVQVV